MQTILASEIKGLIGRINIIDIRDNYIYKIGNIPSSKNVPYGFLITNPEDYLDRDKTYYIYCSVGVNSTKACNILKRLGYKVVNVFGGYHEYIGH